MKSRTSTGLFHKLTCLEIGLEDVWRKGDGPVENSSHPPCQEDVGGAELADAVTGRWSHGCLFTFARTCTGKPGQTSDLPAVLDASQGHSPLTLGREGTFEVFICEEVETVGRHV